MKYDDRKAFVGVDGIATLVSVLSGKVNFQVRRLFKRKRKIEKFTGKVTLICSFVDLFWLGHTEVVRRGHTVKQKKYKLL
jgi:hypothetical protein